MALEIHPLNLGESEGDTSFMVFGMTPGTKVWSPALAYLILGGEEPIVVDAGFRDAEEITAAAGVPFRIAPEQTLEANLARHGLEPGDVGKLVLTHLHFDHTGLVDRFPNARVLVQRTELQYAAAPLFPAMFFDRIDIAKLVSPLWSQIELLDGDAEISPGVRTVLTGGHSPGHQIVYVDVPSGQAIICGDAAYVIDPSVTQGIPPTYVISMPDALAALARIKRDADHVLPMHDATILTTYREGVR
jgi:N-acyl homoserine lactone hydrolase